MEPPLIPKSRPPMVKKLAPFSCLAKSTDISRPDWLVKGDPGRTILISVRPRPAFRPLVPPTPPVPEVALGLTEVALLPTTACVTGLLFQLNWLIIWAFVEKLRIENRIKVCIAFFMATDC